ncbi:MAG: MbnP family protein [Taibaiella sp.]|jgi:hypothetical protein
MKFKFLCLAAASLSILNSCKKDDTVVSGQKGNVAVEFQNYVGSQPLSVSVTGFPYVNANGDSFSVSTYKYYVSNLKFVNSNGTEYAVPESYYLIDTENPSSFSFSISNVPAGTYTAIKVLLGVDSIRNVSGAQTGALDPMHGMFWTWNTGYIMAKVEGTSPQSSTADGKLSFHLGGYSGPLNVLREVTITLPQQLVVGNNSTSKVTFKSDVLKWFESPNLIKFGELSQVNSPGKAASTLADNFSNSLTVSHVQN